MKDNHVLIKDEISDAQTRIISFKGSYKRFDITIISSKVYGNDKLVLDLNGNRFAVLNKDTIELPGFLEHAYNLTEFEAEDLRSFLKEAL